MALRLYVAAVLAALVLVFALGGSTGTVSAHEHRTVAENYEFVVGWNVEPAIANQPNAVFLGLTFFEGGVPEEHEGEEAEGEEAEGEPVVGAEETLEVEVIVGGGAASTMVPLEPAFGEEGAYEGGPIIPTRPGDYTFVITGTLPDGTEINETFESGPDTFSIVEDPAELEFPASEDSGDDSGSSASESSDDNDDSDTALIVAIAAIIVAVLAAGIGIVAVSRSRS